MDPYLIKKEMVRSTWRTTSPSKDGSSFFCGQDEKHIDFPAQGYSVRRQIERRHLVQPLPILGFHCVLILRRGLFIWDRRRMVALGLADTKLRKGFNQYFPGALVPKDFAAFEARCYDVVTEAYEAATEELTPPPVEDSIE